MVMTASARATTGAVHSDDTRDGQRKRRIALGVLALIFAALLSLLLLRLGSHSPNRTPLTSHGNSPVAKVDVPAAPTTGLPAVICTGRDRAIARTPTRDDLKRLKRNAPKVLKRATGKAPKLPSEITGRLLPNGTFSGTCLYGPKAPATTAPGVNY
jgi:hypothetical protein